MEDQQDLPGGSTGIYITDEEQFIKRFTFGEVIANGG